MMSGYRTRPLSCNRAELRSAMFSATTVTGSLYYALASDGLCFTETREWENGSRASCAPAACSPT